jgi:Fe-S-cluster containining protein
MQKIQCKRCGKCCLAEMVIFASDNDRERWHTLGRQDIISCIENSGHQWAGDTVVDKDGNRALGCMFLEYQNGFAICKIYETRPDVCRDFLPGSSEICPQFINDLSS